MRLIWWLSGWALAWHLGGPDSTLRSKKQIKILSLCSLWMQEWRRVNPKLLFMADTWQEGRKSKEAKLVRGDTNRASLRTSRHHELLAMLDLERCTCVLWDPVRKPGKWVRMTEGPSREHLSARIGRWRQKERPKESHGPEETTETRHLNITCKAGPADRTQDCEKWVQ